MTARLKTSAPERPAMAYLWIELSDSSSRSGSRSWITLSPRTTMVKHPSLSAVWCSTSWFTGSYLSLEITSQISSRTIEPAQR